MQPDQPEKKDAAFADEYFRQHADEIPVTFDPAHWNALAATLDAAAGNPTQTLVHRPYGFGKGWWVSGILVLLLGAAWWTRQATVVNALPPDAQGDIKTISLDSEQLKMPERDQLIAPASSNKKLLQKTSITPKGTSSMPNKGSDLPVVIVPIDTSTNAPQIAPPTTNDSLKILPVKKKKHIFW